MGGFSYHQFSELVYYILNVQIMNQNNNSDFRIHLNDHQSTVRYSIISVLF